MATVVTCPCGERFVVRAATFPRTVACHQCGRRAVLFGPDALSSADWTAEELTDAEDPTAEETGAARPRGGPSCAECGRAAEGACSGCGRFYCPWHGRPMTFGRATCSRCYNARRPLMVITAVVYAALGIFLLALPVVAPPPSPPGVPPAHCIMIPAAGLTFVGAAYALWSAVRPFPW